MKIQYKLFVLFVILILIIGFTTIILTSIILKEGLEHHLIDREKIGLELLEKRIFPHIANNDYIKVTSILFEEKEIKKELIYYIIIHDKNENILAHTFLNEIPEQAKYHALEDIEEFSINNVPILAMTIPIKEGAYEVGHLTVGYKKEYIENIISQIIRTIVGIIIILTFFSIILSFFLSKSIVKPVKGLARGMEEFSKGNPNYKIEVNTKDEIGQLAASFQKMTEELQKTTVSKNYVDNIIRSMFGTLVVTTPDGTIRTANRATYDLLGYRAEELIGQPVDILFPKENLQSKSSWLDELIEKGSISNIEKTYLTKDGRKIPMLFSGSVMRHDNNGGTQGIVCVALDITERKRAEDALHESEKRYRTLAEAAHDIIFIINRKDEVQYINSFAAKQFGCRPEELIGKPRGVLFPSDISERHRRNLQKVFNSGMPAHFEDKTLFPNHLMWLDTWLIPLSNEAGEVIAVMGVSRDLTDRKKAEELLLENERLALVSKAKSEFLAAMSHELRTPLNSIIGFSELLKQKTAGELGEKQARYVDNVLTSSKHLLDLINDILDLAKIEAGKMEMVIENFEAIKATNEVISLIKEKAVKHKVFLKKEFDPQLEFIEADQTKFKQILFNLLDNAVKFSKPEGGKVTITAKKEGDMVKISVSDTGIGIREEDMGRLFKEFEQLDSGISRKYGGTGLGLTISKQLVEMHGGKIMVESKYGEGSTFTFLLPLKAKNRREK